MWYLLAATFLLLLLISVALYGKPDNDPWLWGKLSLYYYLKTVRDETYLTT